MEPEPQQAHCLLYFLDVLSDRTVSSGHNFPFGNVSLWKEHVLELGPSAYTLSRFCPEAPPKARALCGSGHTNYLVHFVQPVLVGCQLSHECLVFLPLGVQVACLVVGHVLSCQHLLVNPEFQLVQA